MQSYYPSDDNGILGLGKDRDQTNEPVLFNGVNIQPKVKRVSSFNNTEDIRKINSYMDFFYENGVVFVDGVWYKSPMDAIKLYPDGKEGIERAILQGKVCRRI